jgi:hypothetical protein
MAVGADQLFGLYPTLAEKISKANARLGGLGLTIRVVSTAGFSGAGAPYIASDDFNRTFRNSPFPRARFA